jgi:hypothetical protein
VARHTIPANPGGKAMRIGSTGMLLAGCGADSLQAFIADAGLARRHNTVAFPTALYTMAQESDDAAARARLLSGLRAALKEVP